MLPDASSILATSTNPKNDGPDLGPIPFPSPEYMGVLRCLTSSLTSSPHGGNGCCQAPGYHQDLDGGNGNGQAPHALVDVPAQRWHSHLSTDQAHGVGAQVSEIVRHARETHDILLERLVAIEPNVTGRLRGLCDSFGNAVDELELIDFLAERRLQ